MTPVTHAFNAYWFVALGCAAVVLFIIIQYFRTFVALVWGIYKRRVSGKRAVERLRNLKREEASESQPAASTEVPLSANAEVQQVLKQAPQSEPAISLDLPLQASTESQPVLEHASQLEPAISLDLPLQTSAESQSMFGHAEASQPEPAVSPDLPLQASVEVQPVLEHA